MSASTWLSTKYGSILPVDRFLQVVSVDCINSVSLSWARCTCFFSINDCSQTLLLQLNKIFLD